MNPVLDNDEYRQSCVPHFSVFVLNSCQSTPCHLVGLLSTFVWFVLLVSTNNATTLFFHPDLNTNITSHNGNRFLPIPKACLASNQTRQLCYSSNWTAVVQKMKSNQWALQTTGVLANDLVGEIKLGIETGAVFSSALIIQGMFFRFAKTRSISAVVPASIFIFLQFVVYSMNRHILTVGPGDSICRSMYSAYCPNEDNVGSLFPPGWLSLGQSHVLFSSAGDSSAHDWLRLYLSAEVASVMSLGMANMVANVVRPPGLSRSSNGYS